MEKTVTAIKWLKSQPDRVLIHLDGQPWATVSLLVAGRIEVGDRITAENAARLRDDQERRDAYQAALRWLAGRDRSVHEVRQKLKHKGFGRAAIDHALATLRDKKYLDDQRFALNWITYRINHTPRGPRLLAQELKQKGIDADTVAAVMVHADEDALASACLQRKQRRWQRLEGKIRRHKMLSYLSRKGFAFEASLHAVDRYRDQTD